MEQQTSTTKSDAQLTGKKITIVVSGSRGECQPLVALGVGLKLAGNEVTIAVEERNKDLVEEWGLKYFRVAGDPLLPLYTKEGQEWLVKGQVMTLMKKMNEVTAPYYDQISDDYEKACEGADIIIAAQLTLIKTFSVAEKFKVPWIPVLLGASVPTSEFPNFFITERKLPGFLNSLTYKLIFNMLWWNEKKKINDWRKEKLGLPPGEEIYSAMLKHKVETLCAFDRFVIPGAKRPADWNETYHLTGYFFVPDTPRESVDEGLRNFIDAGDAPIYLGLGSMPAPDPAKFMSLMLEVIKKVQKRAVIVAGWSEFEPTELPADVFMIKSVPHDWLLPRCSVIVHHAGVGTCAAVLRSGVPSVPLPVYLDQPHHSQLLFQLGVAAKPIQFQQLTALKLVEGITSVLKNTAMREKAKAVAAELKIDGVQNAVSVLAQIVSKFKR